MATNISHVSPGRRNEAAPILDEITFIRQEDSLGQQQSTIQRLINGSINQMSVTRLTLDKTFRRMDHDGIVLQNGLRIPLLGCITELNIITERGREFNEQEMIDLITCCQRCRIQKKLLFTDAVLPLSVNSISSIMAMGELEVAWQLMNYEYHLHFASGTWNLTSHGSTNLSSELRQTLSKILSTDVILRKGESKLVLCSKILLLENGSKNKIPISGMNLKWSFRGFDGDNIRLESGLCISSLSSVEKIYINGDWKQRISEEEVTGLLNFGMKSTRFKELWFFNCKLPPSINPGSITEEAKRRNIKVLSSNEAKYLVMENGFWKEPEDIETIKSMCSSQLTIHNDTSESVQRSVIELLVKASNQDISISWLHLGLSFDKIDKDGLNIILKSGLLLPNISSMKKMTIQTEEKREMKEEEVHEIFNYLHHNEKLKELHFMDCLLPSPISLGSSASTLRSRYLNVFWRPDVEKPEQCYWLDPASGHFKKTGSL